MRSGLIWAVVVLAVAGAWFLFNPADSGEGPGQEPIGDTPGQDPEKKGAPELMGSGGTRPIVPTAIRGRGTIQGVAQRAGVGTAAEIELRHVVEIDPSNPLQGGLERMMIERMLDSGISGKKAIGRTTAGDDGRFKFKGLAPGLYEVRATAANGAMGFSSGMLPARGARVEVNVEIPDGDQSLKGRVLYADGKPYKGLVVAAAGEAFAAIMGGAVRVQPAYTDDDGRFEMGGLGKGRYQVSAIIPGVMRVMGAPIEVPYSGEYELNINADGTTVKGKVISAKGEQPIAGAHVFGGGGNPSASFAIFSTKSGEDGRFEMTIPAGRGGGMFVRAEGYAPQTVEFNGNMAEERVVTMLALGQVSGRVVAQDGGTPQRGVTVFATGQSSRSMGFGGAARLALTDADGRYSIQGVPPGAAKVHAIGGGWASVGLTGIGFGEANTPYVVEIEPGGSAELDLEVIPSGKATGRVLSADGRPVPGAVVQAGSGRNAREMIAVMMMLGVSFANDVTDANGVFEIDAIVPGTEYSLAAKAPEYPDAQSVVFTGESGKTETLDITFPKARWLEVRVVAAEGGAPVSGAVVRVQPKRADGMRVVSGFMGLGNQWTTDGAGTVRVGPLPAGELQVVATALSYVEASADVGADQAGSLTVELTKGLVIAGRIQLPDGVPVGSIRVTVQREGNMDGEWFHETATVDAEGRFRVDTIKSAGEYKIRGRGTWQDRRFTGEIRVDTGTEDVVLEMRENDQDKRETVEVHVLDADGKPVPAGQIQMWTFRDQGRSRGSYGTRINNGKALFRGLQPDAEHWIEVYDLIGSSRGATIQGPLVIQGGKVEVRLPRPQSIAGSVTGPDGKGVAGVRIEARPLHPWGKDAGLGQEHGETVTDAEGRFELKGLGPHEYDLQVRAAGNYAPVPATKAQAGDTKVAFTLRAGAQAVLTLVDYAGKPVAGARIWLRPREEGGHRTSSDAQPMSDSKGLLTLKGLEPGAKFDATINVPNGRTDLRRIQLEGWVPVDETLTFGRAYTIEGTVKTNDGKTIRNVNVRYRKVGDKQWQWGTGVKEDGSFTLRELESGSYELRAHAGGMTRAAPVGPGEEPPPEPNVVRARAGAANVKLIIDLGATLVVKVRGMPRSDSGARAHHRTAQLRSEGGNAHAYVQGQWIRFDTVEFRGLEHDQTYRLWISGIADGRYVEKAGLRAQAGTVTVELQQGGTITGTVKWPAAAGALRYVNVSANRPQGQGMSASVDLKTGRFELKGLPDGEWTLTAHGWGAQDRATVWRGTAKASVGGDVEISLKAQEQRSHR